MWYKNIAARFFGLVTNHACDRQTDRQTERQNCDSQDRASIAESRGKNRKMLILQQSFERWPRNSEMRVTPEPIDR